MRGKQVTKFFFLFIFYFVPSVMFSEGSKEIYITTHNTALYFCNDFVGHCNSGGAGDRIQFAIYGCDETSRLYFVTANTHEIIYVGFNAADIPSTCHGVFRIKNLAGTIVYAQSNIPTSGTGYINTITEARNGPFQLYGTGGYSAIDWHPPAAGKYYIEFEEVNNSSGTVQTDNDGFNLNLFDLTVYDSVALQKKLGRLYSKSWQFYEPNTHFSGTNYVYSFDSIITSAVFNDMKGGHWIQFCNQWGCQNTSNFLVDRKSLSNQQAYLPEYMEFLNPPDSVLFPHGIILGQIVQPDPWGERNCNDGTIIFHVTVNKSGTVELDLTFPSPFVTRIITTIVTAGEDLINWDGKDGAGTNVPNNTLVTFTVKYVNGLTNLPLYDVEGNPNGFSVNIVAPSGATPLVYWDDTNISSGGSNLTGCSSPPGGCHSWSDPFGNLNTLNTWWYNVSSTTLPISLAEWRKPQALTFNQQPPQSYCAGTSGVYFSVNTEPNTEQYHWSYTGTGATIIQGSLTDNHITVNFSASATSGSIQVYGTNFNCSSYQGPTSSLAITIKPVPVVNPPLAESICSGSNTSITLNSTPPGSLFSWVSPPPTCTSNIVSCPPGMINSNQINDVLSVNNTNPGTVNYHITGTLNGCTGPQADYIVTVNPTPNVIINSGTPNICSGQAALIQFSSWVPSTTFSWTATGSSANVSGFSNGIGNTINQTLTVSGFSVETVTYAIMPSVNGCSPSAPSNYIVTVNPLPNLANFPAAKTICSGESTNVILTSNVSGSTFTWTCTPSSGNVTGYSDVIFPTGYLNQILYNSGTTSESVTYHVTPQINGCIGLVADFVVTVNPKPHLTTTPFSQTICSESSTNISLTSSLPATTFSWSAQLWSGNITGFSNGAGTVISQPLTNTINTPGIVNYTISFSTALCAGNDTVFPMTVNPKPHLANSPASSQVCNNTNANIILISDVTGALFTWTASGSSVLVTGFSDNITPLITINDLLVNSGNNIETVTYHVTPHANGCNGPVANYVVSVNPTPNLSNSPLSKQQCNNLSTNITFTSNVTGTLFTWTASGSSALVSGFSDNIAPKFLLNQTLVNSGFAVEYVTYHITPQINGCLGTMTNYIVTVYPTPDLSNSPLNKQQCNNLSTGITLTSNVSGTLFTWTATGSSGLVTGFSGNLTPTTSLIQVLINSGYNLETVTYKITPKANGCNGSANNFIVTVYPTPDLSNTPKLMQVCNNIATNLTLTSNVSGTLFTWTCTPSSGNVTGYSNNNIPSGLLNQTLVNSGLNIESVTYHITPHANGCDGTLTDYVVSVVQSPDVYFNPPAQTICSLQSTNIQILSHVPGTTFTWTASGSSVLVTGFLAGAGYTIQQPLTNTGTSIETVTYTVFPTVSGCQSGTSQNVVVTVNPKPVVTNNVTTFQQCSAVTSNISLTSGVTGSDFNWTATGSSLLVTGFSAGSGTAIQQTLINSGFSIEAVTYSVIPIANGCSGDAVPFVVTVFPAPDVYFAPASQTICPLQKSNITIKSHVSGSSFIWTATGSSLLVTGFSSGSGSTIQQTLNNTGYAIETVTYHVSPTANGCPGISADVIVIVDPAPVVSFPVCFDPMVTTNAQPVKLKGGIPLNGTYSGTGVTGSTFYPVVSGSGIFTISYSYINTYSCSNTSTQTITVISPPSFLCGNKMTDIRDNKQYPTVKLGTQCWMAANLNYGNTISGTLTQRDNCIPEKFCFNDVSGNCSSNGGLYQWDEMMKYDNTSGSQGFCPPTWHVPTETEWNTLFSFYITSGFAGSPLKYDGYSGFNALLDGILFQNVNWNFLDFATFFWSSSSHGTLKAWAHAMNSYNPSVSFYPGSRSNAFHVRCIKD